MTTRRLRLTRRMAGEPIDPDIEAGARRLNPDLAIVGSVMLGGVIGAVGRYSATLWWPTPPTGFPWTTFGINVIGSFVLAVLVVLCAEKWPAATLLRPFLGTGVIGGFTTFSTFMLDQQRLFTHGRALTAVVYLIATLLVCAGATLAGQHLTLRVVGGGER